MALDISHLTEKMINCDVAESINEMVKDSEDKEIDFTDKLILEYVHEIIAEGIVTHGLIPINITDAKDREKIEFFRMMLMQPQTDTLLDYINLFKKRFPVGTVCVMDKTISKSLRRSENRRTIIMVESFTKSSMRIRNYHASKVQPSIFKEAGGPDASSLFAYEYVDFVDLYNGELIIDFPKNNKERNVINILFKK